MILIKPPNRSSTFVEPSIQASNARHLRSIQPFSRWDVKPLEFQTQRSKIQKRRARDWPPISESIAFYGDKCPIIPDWNNNRITRAALSAFEIRLERGMHVFAGTHPWGFLCWTRHFWSCLFGGGIFEYFWCVLSYYLFKRHGSDQFLRIKGSKREG